MLKVEMEAREAGESPKPLIEREISEMGFNQPKNPIMLIGLVLPGLSYGHPSRHLRKSNVPFQRGHAAVQCCVQVAEWLLFPQWLLLHFNYWCVAFENCLCTKDQLIFVASHKPSMQHLFAFFYRGTEMLSVRIAVAYGKSVFRVLVQVRNPYSRFLDSITSGSSLSDTSVRRSCAAPFFARLLLSWAGTQNQKHARSRENPAVASGCLILIHACYGHYH